MEVIKFAFNSYTVYNINVQVVLFNIGSIYHKLGQMKNDFWKKTHIGIPDLDTESNDAVVLGFLVAQFIGEVQ